MPEGTFSFDLHVLSLPPTFNLSHDQTLQFITEAIPARSRPEGLDVHRSQVDRFCSMNFELMLVIHPDASPRDAHPAVNYRHPHEWLVQFLKC
jgi:hypothetical protein